MRFISRTGTVALASSLTLLSALAFGATAYAQGLGAIIADSGLNQPLRAHIELLDVSKLDASQIKVALATDAEFDLARVTRGANLNLLKFQIEMQRDGTGRILVTTNESVAEPFLDFLVGVTWPNGRTLREYTLLLDLAANNKTTAAAPRTSAAAASNAASSFTNTSSAKEYEVQKGDTLYQIAEQTRPSANVGVQQMMVAIQRANEDSFVNNNVNRIMTGKVLRIPRQDEISLIDQEAAVAQINQQNQALDAQPLAVNDSTGAKAASSRDELTLLSGDQDAGGGGSRDLDATIKSLQNQMMLSEESLDRSKLENLELTNRLNAVQEQIDLLQNIIAIEDERIAQLQKQLSSQSVATKDALASAESAAQAAGGADADEGILGLLSNSVVLLGVLLAVVASVALFLFIKRRNAQAEMADDAEVSLDDLADVNEAERSGGIGAMLAAFMARFRRSEAAEVEEPVFAEEGIAAPVMTAETVVEKPASTQSTTNKLLDEMGFGDDFMDLENALDEVENVSEASHPNATQIAQAPAAMPAKDTAVEEAGAVMEEAALLEQALNEAEEQADQEHEDFLQAAAEPIIPEPTAPATGVPEAFAFTPDTDDAEDQAPTKVESVVEDKPEVFEFTLPNLEDLDDDEDTAIAEAEAEDKVESISFNTSALILDSDDSKDDALEVLSFDEDSVSLDDDNEESSDLSGPQDTHDARLDLAVAYEAMGDIDGAVEILEEVIASGKGGQITEAKRLKQKWQNG